MIRVLIVPAVLAAFLFVPDWLASWCDRAIARRSARKIRAEIARSRLVMLVTRKGSPDVWARTTVKLRENAWRN